MCVCACGRTCVCGVCGCVPACMQTHPSTTHPSRHSRSPAVPMAPQRAHPAAPGVPGCTGSSGGSAEHTACSIHREPPKCSPGAVPGPRGRARGAGWEVCPCPGQLSSWWVSELAGPGLCARSREGLSSRSISRGMLSGPAPCRQCPAAAWALSPWHRQVTGAVGRVTALVVPVLGPPGGQLRAQGSPGQQPVCAAGSLGVGVLAQAKAARALCWRSTGLATLVASRSDGDEGAVLLPSFPLQVGWC